MCPSSTPCRLGGWGPRRGLSGGARARFIMRRSRSYWRYNGRLVVRRRGRGGLFGRVGFMFARNEATKNSRGRIGGRKRFHTRGRGGFDFDGVVLGGLGRLGISHSHGRLFVLRARRSRKHIVVDTSVFGLASDALQAESLDMTMIASVEAASVRSILNSMIRRRAVADAKRTCAETSSVLDWREGDGQQMFGTQIQHHIPRP